MYYEINVSLNGKHLFATHQRSITYASEVLHVYEIFEAKFPKSEGYHLSVSQYNTVGHSVDVDKLKPRVTGWHLAVHLKDGTAYTTGHGTQEWDNVLIGAHDCFDAEYGDEEGRSIAVNFIHVYAEMSDGENVHRFTWNNKEEVA